MSSKISIIAAIHHALMLSALVSHIAVELFAFTWLSLELNCRAFRFWRSVKACSPRLHTNPTERQHKRRQFIVSFFLLARSAEAMEELGKIRAIKWASSGAWVLRFNCKAIWGARLIRRREWNSVGEIANRNRIFLISRRTANAFVSVGIENAIWSNLFLSLFDRPIVLYFNRLSFCFFAGRRGLEVRLHGTRPFLLVGLHTVMCGRHTRHHLRVAIALRHSRARRSAAQRDSFEKK